MPKERNAGTQILVAIALAFFEHQDGIALFCQTHGRHAGSESGADDDVIEAVRVQHLTLSFRPAGF